jgi:RHS repeat-associated protein
LNTALFQYQYDAGSNEIHRYAYLPNNVTIDQNYARDSLDRMASRLVKKNGTTFSSEAYTLDHMDRLTQTARGNTADAFGFYLDGNLEFATYGGQPQIPYTEGQDPDLDTTDTIDPNAGYQPPDSEEPEPTPPPPAIDYVPPNNPDQDAQQSPGAQRIVGYALDRPGNRSVMLDTVNGNVTYSDNALNQYTGVSGSSITNGPEHEVQTFNGVTYSYINDEHLKQVSDGSGNNYYLYYDALGRCVKRTLNGTTTFYICDGEKPIVEYNSSGTIIARNVYGKGIDEILTRTETGVNNGYAMYYAQDHEGTVTHLLDGRSTPSNQTGNVIESYTYDVYGAPVFLDANGNQRNPNCTAYNNRFLFTGREYAATYRGTYVQAFTFYEYRARAYNPQLGRFMSEDPKLFDAGDTDNSTSITTGLLR